MKILIADDSAIPRLILHKTLTSLGHETVAAADGVEAWALFQTFRPDVVLSDWLMPGTDGDRAVRPDPGLRPRPLHILRAAHRDDRARTRRHRHDGRRR
ncbi:MAG: response regulator [Chloroflexi bacterium]|nr:response regulator [Chloroflexota bacterium]